MKYLLVDFGSTYTKLTAIDSDKLCIVGTSKAITTITTNILDGYDSALAILENNIGKVEYDKILACSSAAGGLKMAALGLVPELTVEAAKRACLGAGAKVSKVVISKLNNREIKSIIDEKIDIILLAGGTDGGNSECILYNAKKISGANLNIPIIVAGNKDCSDEIEEIFSKADIRYEIVDNVMPKVNELDIDGAKEEIRKVFLDTIIEAKGIKKAQEKVGSVIMPTPEAVLKAAKLLSDGFEEEIGVGDLVVVDIGGATTDIHSIGHGMPTRADVTLKGLDEPYSKRTVEGDLGMRYSIMSIIDGYGEYRLNQLVDKKYDMKAECQKRYNDITIVPKSESDYEIENALAYACSDISMSRHVGILESFYTQFGQMNYQTGKDLSNVKCIIGTGGVIINSNDYEYILSGVCRNDSSANELRPNKPKLRIDNHYILSAMGVLSEYDEMTAIKIMKKYIMEDNVDE
ncbi:MAG: methylaspartate mutase accessory protein GlmL [Bacilli bacterium]